MPINVLCWLFKGFGITSGGKEVRRDYTAEHVNRFADQITRRSSIPLRVVCVTDMPTGIHCDVIPMPRGLNWPKAYRKLWAFSREAAALLPGRIFVSDIDVEVVGDIAPLLDRSEALVAWQDAAHPPGRLSSGNYLLTAGSHPEVWENFSFEAMADARLWHEQKFGRMTGSDQAWMSYALRHGVATFGPGIYRSKNIGADLPADARIVHFSGNLKPWHSVAKTRYPWLT